MAGKKMTRHGNVDKPRLNGRIGVTPSVVKVNGEMISHCVKLRHDGKYSSASSSSLFSLK